MDGLLEKTEKFYILKMEATIGNFKKVEQKMICILFIFLTQEKCWWCWAVGKNNTVLKTIDGGCNWQFVEINQDTIKSFYEITFSDKNNGWLISNHGELFHTTDEGKYWNLDLKWEPGCAGFLRFINSDIGIVKPGRGNQIYITTNGGKNWRNKLVNISMAWETDICFIDRNYGWICNSRLASSKSEDYSSVYFTSNGGENWEQISTLPEMRLGAIYFIDRHNGWVAGNKIYHTYDGGYTWNCQTPNLLEFFQDIFFYNSSTVWALDFSGNIYKFIPE